METERQKQVVDELTKYDLAGVKYPQARAEMLAKGYTEAEITQGLYSAPFDGKDNRVREVAPIQKYYQEHPEQAERMAKRFLGDVAADDLDKTKQKMVASMVRPGIYSGYAESRFLDQLGISFWRYAFAEILLILVSLGLHMVPWVSYQIANMISGVLQVAIIMALYRQWHVAHKLRKEVAEQYKQDK